MIPKGNDIELRLTVVQTYENAFGKKVTTPIDLTAYQGYVLLIYPEEDPSNIIAKYSLNPMTGYGDIEVIDAVNGIIQINLDKTITSVAPIGMLYGLLKTNLVNADFSTGVQLTSEDFPIDSIEDLPGTNIVPAAP